MTSSASAERTGEIWEHGTQVLPKFAKIDQGATGDVVAAVSGKKIRVFAYCLSASAAMTAKFRSNTTDITGNHNFAAADAFASPYSPLGLFETAVGEALNLSQTAVSIGGWVLYGEVSAAT